MSGALATGHGYLASSQAHAPDTSVLRSEALSGFCVLYFRCSVVVFPSILPR